MAEHAKPGVQEFRVPPRIYVIWIAILGLIPLLVIFRQNAAARRVPQLTQYEFIQNLDNHIAHATITLDPNSPYLRDVRGRYFKTDPAGKTVIEQGKPVEVPFYARVYLSDQTLQELLNRPMFSARRPNTLVANLVSSLLPVFIVALLIYWFLIRPLKRATKREGSA